MIENFIRAYDSIGQKKIMGIYGGNHIAQSDPEIMTGAIKEHYGEIAFCSYVACTEYLLGMRSEESM